MKKIVYVLLAACFVGLLSSCVVVDPHHDLEFGNTLYVYNDSNRNVEDWYVTCEHGDVYNPSSSRRRIRHDDYSYIDDLKDDYYFLSILIEDYEWYDTNYTKIRRDTDYIIKNYTNDDYFRNHRSAASDESTENQISGFYLEGSDGSIIELVEIKK